MLKQMAQRGDLHPDSFPPSHLQFGSHVAATHEGLNTRELGWIMQTTASQVVLRAGVEGLACMDRVPRCYGPGGTLTDKAG